ncbi:3-hydroxyanthranilate 3,4-dioxygenase [Haloechinothrix sp. YIM 98757]|uniref:3-hydroxyanthranilate 3,4-dioxygenase n=1 Tax=Haloechinothrix aidingensis TaxID=2752311 RepID=A0A838A7G8_9PSEU|nr:3-hydroxyanthranilate 3,4-dioxygenase [Haloechinothrix aidingensis]MBA0124271.1 3-hydroxyanthranilate 3,4-dioxygenase [Haloechinothrix aidingensis]
MSGIPPSINFEQWVKDNEDQLKPPVNNKQVWERVDDFIVQVIGGPNQRTDFHVDPYEEWFYQFKGDMHVNLMTGDGLETVHINEGDMWLLPRDIPHSPQRPDSDSIGLVIERLREEGTLEKFQWYCQRCEHLVHEVQLQVRDIVADLPPVFEAFYADTEARTCGRCGELHPGRG